MAGGGKIQIKGGIASKREAVVIDGALLVTAVGGVGGAGVIEHSFFASVDALGVTEIDLMDADPIGPALPILRAVTVEDIGVSFLHDAAPEGGTWTVRVQRRASGSDIFSEEATFVFAK